MCVCPQQHSHELAREPSTTKNSSSSRAPKTSAQLRDNRGSAKNEMLLLLLLKGYIILKEKLLLDGLTLAIFSFFFFGKMCVFVSRPMKIVTFLRKNDYSPKRVVDFPWERDTFRNKIVEIVEDFQGKRYNNNGKPWKSSRILRVNPFFPFFFLFFIIFLHFFVFFHFFIFSFFSISFIFLSFAFMFFHVLSFSFIFPFSFIC